MVHLDIKPLSLNNAYRGRRFKTPELEQFKKDVWRLLPKLEIPDGKLGVTFHFGVSSKASDGDNLIKVMQDAIAEAYEFNDKRIYEWHVKKIDVPKGREYIDFHISTIDATEP